MNESVTARMVRAAKLDIGVYEELEADRSATQQALLVVVVIALLDGLGLGLGSLFVGGQADDFIGSLVIGAIAAVFGWFVWSYITYFIGTSIFGGTATPGELLRTIGFAQSPRALNVFSFIPVIGGLIRFVVFFWVLVAGIVAIRQALNITTGKAIATALIGWLAMLIISALAAALVALLGFGASLVT